MRNLRERLNFIASTPNAVRQEAKSEKDLFFCREHRIPVSSLRGVEKTTLDEIQACDPAFTGTTWDIRKLLFLDTETTGLSGGAGTVAFEIGIGWLEAESFVIRQYVMRDYHEEGPMLEAIASIIRQFDTFVTFNGKSFDLPLLESRMTMNRIRLNVTSWPHFDLLHAARRVYKLRLGRCNLSALESSIFGIERDDDLPGSLVPQRYFEYIKTGEFALLEDVLRHNKQDVQSLAELTGHLCAVFRNPDELLYAEDLFGVGKTLLKTGRTSKARRCLRLVGKGALAGKAYTQLALSYKKEREWPQALEAWQEMISRGEGGVWPYIEMAKYYEHACRDDRRALTYAQNALNYLLNHASLRGNDTQQEELIFRRIARLKRRLMRSDK